MSEEKKEKRPMPSPLDTSVDLASDTGTIAIEPSENFDHWRQSRYSGGRKKIATGALFAVLAVGALVGAGLLIVQLTV